MSRRYAVTTQWLGSLPVTPRAPPLPDDKVPLVAGPLHAELAVLSIFLCDLCLSIRPGRPKIGRRRGSVDTNDSYREDNKGRGKPIPTHYRDRKIPILNIFA